MTIEQNEIASDLFFQLKQQLARTTFTVRLNLGHMRRSDDSYYIPDVFVIPTELTRPLRGQRTLEVYDLPLPLIVEIWSRSTGDYDVEAKIPEYQRRGDLEIWRIHPYEHTLTAWRQQPDGSYVNVIYADGIVEPRALPNVHIDLDALFDQPAD